MKHLLVILFLNYVGIAMNRIHDIYLFTSKYIFALHEIQILPAFSYIIYNYKSLHTFLENDVNDLRNLKNINGTKIVDKPSIKNSRSLPQISDIW